jgi:hypothetical protein
MSSKSTSPSFFIIKALRPDFCSILLFRFGDQESLYNQERETYDPGVWLSCRDKHDYREYQLADSRH